MGEWEKIAPFPGKGFDAPNTAVVNGSLYVFGGWRANAAGMKAWQLDENSLYGLNLPVPITVGTNGAELLRHAWKYTVASDTWTRLPDLPLHMCQGGVVVVQGRYIVQLGSSHGRNSFRTGSNDPEVRELKGLCGGKPIQDCPLGLIPDLKVQRVVK